MATHSSILAWEISQRDKPGGLQSMGLQRVGHNARMHNNNYSDKNHHYGRLEWKCVGKQDIYMVSKNLPGPIHYKEGNSRLEKPG